MRRLLAANLRRLWLTNIFWYSLVFMMGVQVLYSLMLARDPMPRDVTLFISMQFISIVVAVFYSLFLGTEYSDGTIRNKLLVGHRRSKVYLASLVTGFVAVTLIYLAVVLVGWLMGSFFFEAAYNSLETIFLTGLTGWFACLTFVSIYTLIGLLSASKALTAIINILLAFGALFVGLYAFQVLGKPCMQALSAKQTIFQFIFDVNPAGQLLQTMTLNVASPWKLMGYSAVLTVIVTSIGIFLFNKKDLK